MASMRRQHEAGIVYKVVESSELEAEVLKAAEEIAAKPPQAMQIARSLMRMPAEPVADRIAREAKHFAERLTSSEAREAVMAFLSRKSNLNKNYPDGITIRVACWRSAKLVAPASRPLMSGKVLHLSRRPPSGALFFR